MIGTVVYGMEVMDGMEVMTLSAECKSKRSGELSGEVKGLILCGPYEKGGSFVQS